MGRAIALLFVAVLAACGSSSSSPPAPAPAPAPAAATCPDGFAPLDADTGCAPIAAASCAPGTRASIGQTACVPVGVTACPTGFTPHASGWGCDAVVAASACKDDTREHLGDASCAPVADCDAPFPPAAATLFVSPTAVVDATHFTTIGDAVAAASAGAVIAVDAGTYAETLAPTKPVTIVGRCPKQVTLQASGDGVGPGISLKDADATVIENLTLRGFLIGVALFSGNATIDSVVADGNVKTGLLASGVGTKLTVTNSVVRGTRVYGTDQQAFGVAAEHGASIEMTDSVASENEVFNVVATQPGSTLHVSRSIVRDGVPAKENALAGLEGMGVYVSNAATATIEESLVKDNFADGVVAATGGGSPATVTVLRSVVEGTKLDAQGFGRGVEAGHASTLTVEETSIAGNAEFGVLSGTGASVDVHDSTIFGAPNDDPKALGGPGVLVTDPGSSAKLRSIAIVGARGAGVQLEAKASADVSASTVQTTRLTPNVPLGTVAFATALSVTDGSTFTAEDVDVEKAQLIAVLVQASTATMSDLLVRGTLSAPPDGAGRALDVQDGGTADVSRSAFEDSVEVGVAVLDQGSSLALHDSTVSGVDLTAAEIGVGVFVETGGSASIDGSTLTAAKGVAVADSGSSVLLRACVVSESPVALAAQDGSAVVAAEDATDPTALTVTSDTRFVDVATRLGEGALPLPTALAPAAPTAP